MHAHGHAPHRRATTDSVSIAKTVVVRATVSIVATRGLNDPDWEQNLRVVDLVMRQPSSMAPLVAAALLDVLKAYYHRDSNVLWLALVLAETLVKNCGTPLHRAVASKSWVKILRKIAGKVIRKPGIYAPPALARDIIKHRVQMKVLSLIQAWGPLHPKELRLYNDEHAKLLKKGVVFPPATAEDKAPYTEGERKRRVQESKQEIRLPQAAQDVMARCRAAVAELDPFVDGESSGDRVSDESVAAASGARKARDALNAEIQRTLTGSMSENDEKVLSAMLMLHERVDRALAAYDGDDADSASREPNSEPASRTTSFAAGAGGGAASSTPSAPGKADLLLDFSSESDHSDSDSDDHADSGPVVVAPTPSAPPADDPFDIFGFAEMDKPAPTAANRSLRDSQKVSTGKEEDNFMDWLLDSVPATPPPAHGAPPPAYSQPLMDMWAAPPQQSAAGGQQAPADPFVSDFNPFA